MNIMHSGDFLTDRMDEYAETCGKILKLNTDLDGYCHFSINCDNCPFSAIHNSKWPCEKGDTIKLAKRFLKLHKRLKIKYTIYGDKI